MNNANPTLIILTPGFPQSEADINCLPMQQNFVKALKEQNPQLNIIILSFQYPFFKKNYEWFNNRVISFGGKNKGGLKKILLWKKISATLKELSSNNNITAIISFWYGEAALIGSRFAKKNNLRHYCWLLGQDAKKENQYPKRVKANAGELVALSDFLQDEFEKNHGIRSSHVITPGIDIKQFGLHTKEKRIDILAAGSLIPLKRYDMLLEIINEIKKELPAIRCILVGTGPEKTKLETLISKYGLKQNLLLTDELPYGEVLQLMQTATIFLHPSSYEGFSGVCLEAITGGAEVISFCRAMHSDIEHWHIVKTKEEMKEKALVILQNKNINPAPASPYLIKDTAASFAKLFS